MIKENRNNTGIVIRETEHKISQFADDTDLFQNGKGKTFEETIRALGDFGNKSELKIYTEKNNNTHTQKHTKNCGMVGIKY